MDQGILIDEMVSLFRDKSWVTEILKMITPSEFAVGLDFLRERERDIIILFYGIGDVESMGMKQISDKFNLSYTRTIEINKRARMRLFAFLAGRISVSQG